MRHALSVTAVLLSAFAGAHLASAGDQCRGLTVTTCNAVQAICFGLLDLDPVSCGVYYGCCYNKAIGPTGDKCRANPCGVGCATDGCLAATGIGASPQGLVVDPASIASNVAPGATAAGMLSTIVAKGSDGAVLYNWWVLGQGQHGWLELNGSVRTDVAPAAALVGTYVYVVIKGVDGQLYLNQGEVNKSFAGWQRLGLTSEVAPAASSSGNTTVVVARDTRGRVFYSYWDIGQSRSRWKEILGDVPTTSSLGAALVGSYLFVVARGTDGDVYLNQGALNEAFVGWQKMNFHSNVAVGATSAGTTSVAVARDANGRVFYNWWNLGEAAKGWTPLGDDVRTDVTPVAALVEDYLFVVATDRDGRIRLNQGTLGKDFVGWR